MNHNQKDLTPAAQTILDEYIDDFRIKILQNASAHSSLERIEADDVIHALANLNKSHFEYRKYDREQDYHLNLNVGYGRITKKLRLMAILGLTYALMGLLILIFSLLYPSTNLDENTVQLLWIAGPTFIILGIILFAFGAIFNTRLKKKIEHPHGIIP